MSSSQVEQLKNEGNKHFSAGNHTEAIKAFSAAIELAPDNHVLYSNRSASYASLKDYTLALEDAEKCVSIQPKWAKGYSRLGAALHGLSRLDDASKAYEDGLKIEPENAQLKKGVEDVKKAQDALEARYSAGAGGPTGGNGLGGMFSGPNVLPKLASDPRTSKYISDPSFLNLLRELQTDSTALQRNMNDPRMLDILSVLMNMDFSKAAAGGPSDDQAPMETSSGAAEGPKKQAPAEPAKKVAEPEPEPVVSEEDENKAKAAKEKDLGTAAYKKRQFEEALAHYTKASELDGNDIAHLNNIAAVHLESKQYDKCIEVCQQAVEKGRELRSDYKLIARALGRIGSAYQKQDNLAEAIKYFNKSLTEHRTPDILEKLKETEKLKEKREKEAYINPELSEQEREKGNELFKKSDFPGAVRAYTEAIKRNPSDAKNYANRSASYLKMMAVPEALKDAEDGVAVDPTYTKAYVRKAAALLALKRYSECLSTLDEAEDRDTDKKNQSEIAQTRQKAYIAQQTTNANASEEEIRARARQDPEVQQIMSDPVMRNILDQMQNEPEAVREHLKNPMVAKKIQKLVDVGIIRVGSH